MLAGEVEQKRVVRACRSRPCHATPQLLFGFVGQHDLGEEPWFDRVGVSSRGSRGLAHRGQVRLDDLLGDAVAEDDAVSHFASQAHHARTFCGEVERNAGGRPQKPHLRSFVVGRLAVDELAERTAVPRDLIDGGGSAAHVPHGAIASTDAEDGAPVRQLLQRGEAARRDRRMTRDGVAHRGAQLDPRRAHGHGGERHVRVGQQVLRVAVACEVVAGVFGDSDPVEVLGHRLAHRGDAEPCAWCFVHRSSFIRMRLLRDGCGVRFRRSRAVLARRARCAHRAWVVARSTCDVPRR
ncbi:unannotated protein [freshwater metagenome]|uniref:Unannotated protein n=1 Tax=freshwater metagenome TaxID=449393 RepID=A0A6J7ATV3_9ZZZZ